VLEKFAEMKNMIKGRR